MRGCFLERQGLHRGSVEPERKKHPCIPSISWLEIRNASPP